MRGRLSSLEPLLRIFAITAAAFVLFGAIGAAFGQDVGIYAVQCAVLVYLWSFVRKTLKNPRQLIILRGIRPRHFLLAVIVLSGTLTAILLLLAPDSFLRWGWWDSLGGNGNVIFGQTTGPTSVISGVVLPILIVVPLALSLCFFALREERIFRRGDERRGLGGRLWRSLVFGLAHLVMGIPIGAAIGLGVGGFGFSQVYLRRWRESRSRHQSVLDSARVHFAYNLILIGMVAVMLVLAAEGSFGAR